MREAAQPQADGAAGMDELFLPTIEAGTFVLGCFAIHANRTRPIAVSEVLLLIAWMVGVLSMLAVLNYRF